MYYIKKNYYYLYLHKCKLEIIYNNNYLVDLLIINFINSFHNFGQSQNKKKVKQKAHNRFSV